MPTEVGQNPTRLSQLGTPGRSGPMKPLTQSPSVSSLSKARPCAHRARQDQRMAALGASVARRVGRVLKTVGSFPTEAEEPYRLSQ